jgi:glycine/D-amino acid oxidase-like deaminating enzyme
MRDRAERRATSLWEATTPPEAVVVRAPLPGDRDADVVIVGAGFTGLWTAHSLLRIDPSLRVVVVERERVGFGASGRNGGWCSALLPMSLDAMAAASGRDAAIRMQRAMFDTVAEVAATTAAESIDCDLAPGGYVALARNRPQLRRLEDDVATMASYGFGDADLRLLDAPTARARVGMTSVIGGTFTPHCSAVHPGRLVHGLAAAAERLGAVIHERTAATSIEPGIVRTDHGNVRADVVVRATEAYTAQLPGLRRQILPIYSLMVATEPLPAEFWVRAGVNDRETFNDARHLIVYGQRTADDRLAFGGRGARYHAASQVRDRYDIDRRVHSRLVAALTELFPYLGEVQITHRWGGPLGIARDWSASVGLDRATGMAWAGGYVGDGVAASNLAGRTLAALVTGTEGEITTLPWVQHRSPRWEPEPLRWLGVRAGALLPDSIDRAEARAGRRPPLRTWLASRTTGH